MATRRLSERLVAALAVLALMLSSTAGAAARAPAAPAGADLSSQQRKVLRQYAADT